MCEWKRKERRAEMVNEKERETGGKTLCMPANQDYSSGLFGKPSPYVCCPNIHLEMLSFRSS